MKYLPLFLFLFVSLAASGQIVPRTEYTKDRYFVTTGELDFPLDAGDVAMALLKYNDYDHWALKGMQGVDKESEGLIVYFTGIDYSASEGVFLISFDINLIWPFGRKGLVMAMRPVQKFNSQGNLQSITLIPLLGTKMVEDARLIFNLKDKPGGSAISFESKIKLTKFLDFFFSLKAYKKNFEWYVFKVAENFSDYLNDMN